MNRFLLLQALVLPLLLWSHAAFAADKPLRVVNEDYRFAFTFEPGTKVAYEEGGVGMSGTHKPDGAATADYGVLVYGSPSMRLSETDAAAAGLDKSHATIAASAVTEAQWPAMFRAIMESRGHTAAGEVNLGGTATPYFTWEQKAGARTHYAMMYVVKHGDDFVYVQAESSTPFSAARRQWLTGKLELLEPRGAEPRDSATSVGQ